MERKLCQAYLEDGRCELRVRERPGKGWKVLRRWSHEEAYGSAGTVGFSAV
jgi:hypothetical protein